MAEEAKKYLDYDGLAYLVEKLTNKIEASGSGGGSDAHAVDVLRSVVTFPTKPQTGSDGSVLGSYDPGADDIPLGDVVELADDLTDAEMECEDSRFVMKESGSLRLGFTYYITCAESNGTGTDIHATLRLTLHFSDGEERTVNVIAVQSAAAASAADGVYAGYTDADGVNRIVSPDKWDDSLGTLCGVAVVEGGRGLLVAPANLSSASNFGTTVGDIGGATTTDEAAALCDTDGRMNTLLARAAGAGEASAAAVALSAEYSYGTVCARRWFIGGLGQWAAVGRRYDEVNSALSALGGSGLGDGLYYWTSTQYNSGNVWIYNASTMRTSWESAGNTGLITTWPGRAFAEWDYVL